MAKVDAGSSVNTAWAQLEPEFTELCHHYPKLAKTNHIHHLGTLGTGTHIIEVCLDEAGLVRFMLHSGSRGVGISLTSRTRAWLA